MHFWRRSGRERPHDCGHMTVSFRLKTGLGSSNAGSLVLDSHFDRRMEPEPGYSAGIAFQYLQSPAALFMEQHVARHGNMARDDEGKAPKRVNILFEIAARSINISCGLVQIRWGVGHPTSSIHGDEKGVG